MSDPILAITVLLGLKDDLWMYLGIDEVEWTDPSYGHQN